MRTFFSVLGAACLASMCLAETNRSLPGHKFTVAPVIDGVIGANEWVGAPIASGFTDPISSQVPQAADTRVRFGYTAEGIYAVFECDDPEPNGIVARSIQPGSSMDGEDIVLFAIDPFNRRTQNTSRFIVNPLGTKTEAIAGGRSAKREWRGEWKAAAKTTDKGWIAEIFIPWRILEMPANRPMPMQINFLRYQARTRVKSFWSDITRRELPEHDGTWLDVSPPTQSLENPLKIQAYAAPEFDEDADPRLNLRSGFDLKYRLSGQMNAILSINPDIKNIEQQIASIEFTRGERFVSDARPFFTEGSGFFRLSQEFGYGQVFYSRRISDFDQGVKVFGALDKTTNVGMLVTREDGRRTDAVMRLRKIYGPRTAGSVYGTVSQGDGRENSLMGASFDHGMGNFAGGVDFSRSVDHGTVGSAGNAYAFYSSPPLLVMADWQWVEPEYRPALGLISFRNRLGGYLFSEYSNEYRSGPIRQLRGELYAEDFRNYQGANSQRTISIDMSALTKHDFRIGTSFYADKFENEPSATMSIRGTFNASNPQKTFGFSYETGHRAGELSTFLRANVNWRPVKGLDLSVSKSILNFVGKDDQTIFGAGWEVDASQSLTARLVKRNEDTSWYLAYRKAGNKGLEYYLIIGDPNSLTTRNRVALKLVWAS